MSKPTVFALVDANNFFVSCERIFRPDLVGKPVIVRSSNDGCVVARSNEAKALGIPMGAPVFKIRSILETHQVTEFSGSFDLYGDISRRLTETLRAFAPQLEAYSVDESFLDLSDLCINDYEAWGRAVRRAVWRTIGIPVSVGIAPTKTLAKLMSDLAKKDWEGSGVVSLMRQPEHRIDKALIQTPLKDIWGVGWRLAPKLQAEGIATAYDLKTMDPHHARSLMGIHGRQLVAELNGTSCYPIESSERPHKSLSRTRMFGQDTNELYVLEAAIANLAATACARLREYRLLTRSASLFLTTNKHRPGYRRWIQEVKFPAPTADTGQIVARLVQALTEIYSASQLYHRGGVLLYDLVGAKHYQADLFGLADPAEFDTSQARMQAIDHLNTRFGNGKVRYAAENLSQAWRPRQGRRSPRYTTEWAELPIAIISP